MSTHTPRIAKGFYTRDYGSNQSPASIRGVVIHRDTEGITIWTPPNMQTSFLEHEFEIVGIDHETPADAELLKAYATFRTSPAHT